MLAAMKDLSVRVLAKAEITIDSPFAIVLERDAEGTRATLSAKMHVGKGTKKQSAWVQLHCSSIQAVGYFERPQFILTETLKQLAGTSPATVNSALHAGLA